LVEGDRPFAICQFRERASLLNRQLNSHRRPLDSLGEALAH
jgi:hypothetical protein